jgi:hypothetical protein
MTAGKFQLAKYRRGDVREYVLFEGNKRHPDTGFYTTSKEAMAVAEELASRQA